MKNSLPNDYFVENEKVFKRLKSGVVKKCAVVESDSPHLSDFVSIGKKRERYYLHIDSMTQSPVYFPGINNAIREVLEKKGYMYRSPLTGAYFFRKRLVRSKDVVHYLQVKVLHAQTTLKEPIRKLILSHNVAFNPRDAEKIAGFFSIPAEELNIVEVSSEKIENLAKTLGLSQFQVISVLKSCPHDDESEILAALVRAVNLDRQVSISEEVLLNNTLKSSEKMSIALYNSYFKHTSSSQASRYSTFREIPSATKALFFRYYRVTFSSTEDVAKAYGARGGKRYCIHHIDKAGLSYADQINLLRFKIANIVPPDASLVRLVHANMLSLSSVDDLETYKPSSYGNY